MKNHRGSSSKGKGLCAEPRPRKTTFLQPRFSQPEPGGWDAPGLGGVGGEEPESSRSLQPPSIPVAAISMLLGQGVGDGKRSPGKEEG